MASGGDLKTVRAKLAVLQRRLRHLENAAPTTGIIQTLAPAPYEILKPIQVLIKADGDEFVACFVDANIATGGSTLEEAVENLKDILVSTMEVLESHRPEQLGPGPAKQLAVLREFIRKR